VTTTSLGGRAAPGGLLRMVAERLAGAGLDVSAPAEEEDGCRLDIAMPGARCTLAVGDCGSAEWEYWPWSADDADPDLTADLATVLLTGQAGPQPRLAGHQRENVTFKGIVGLELKARGLEVELAVYCDETAFDLRRDHCHGSRARRRRRAGLRDRRRRPDLDTRLLGRGSRDGFRTGPMRPGHRPCQRRQCGGRGGHAGDIVPAPGRGKAGGPWLNGC
jgi:hypothetical protein